MKAARRMKEGKGCRLDGGIVALCGRAGPERQCLRGRPERQRTAPSGKFGPRSVGVRPEEPRKQWETLGKPAGGNAKNNSTFNNRGKSQSWSSGCGVRVLALATGQLWLRVCGREGTSARGKNTRRSPRGLGRRLTLSCTLRLMSSTLSLFFFYQRGARTWRATLPNSPAAVTLETMCGGMGWIYCGSSIAWASFSQRTRDC